MTQKRTEPTLRDIEAARRLKAAISEKKKADKSRDEYQLTVWAVNNSGQTIYATNNNTGGVRIANAKSTRKTVRANAINAQLQTVRGQTLVTIPAAFQHLWHQATPYNCVLNSNFEPRPLTGISI